MFHQYKYRKAGYYNMKYSNKINDTYRKMFVDTLEKINKLPNVKLIADRTVIDEELGLTGKSRGGRKSQNTHDTSLVFTSDFYVTKYDFRLERYDGRSNIGRTRHYSSRNSRPVDISFVGNEPNEIASSALDIDMLHDYTSVVFNSCKHDVPNMSGNNAGKSLYDPFFDPMFMHVVESGEDDLFKKLDEYFNEVLDAYNSAVKAGTKEAQDQFKADYGMFSVFLAKFDNYMKIDEKTGFAYIDPNVNSNLASIYYSIFLSDAFKVKTLCAYSNCLSIDDMTVEKFDKLTKDFSFDVDKALNSENLKHRDEPDKIFDERVIGSVLAKFYPDMKDNPLGHSFKELEIVEMMEYKYSVQAMQAKLDSLYDLLSKMDKDISMNRSKNVEDHKVDILDYLSDKTLYDGDVFGAIQGLNALATYGYSKTFIETDRSANFDKNIMSFSNVNAKRLMNEIYHNDVNDEYQNDTPSHMHTYVKSFGNTFNYTSQDRNRVDQHRLYQAYHDYKYEEQKLMGDKADIPCAKLCFDATLNPFIEIDGMFLSLDEFIDPKKLDKNYQKVMSVKSKYPCLNMITDPEFMRGCVADFFTSPKPYNVVSKMPTTVDDRNFQFTNKDFDLLSLEMVAFNKLVNEPAPKNKANFEDMSVYNAEHAAIIGIRNKMVSENFSFRNANNPKDSDSFFGRDITRMIARPERSNNYLMGSIYEANIRHIGIDNIIEMAGSKEKVEYLRGVKDALSDESKNDDIKISKLVIDRAKHIRSNSLYDNVFDILDKNTDKPEVRAVFDNVNAFLEQIDKFGIKLAESDYYDNMVNNDLDGVPKDYIKSFFRLCL